MAAKKIAYDQEAREAIREGVRKLARAVKITLGPRGRNVVIEKSFGAPTVTKDGVTVGAPKLFSMTTFRPRGPSVILTALASFRTPSRIASRAS